MTKLPTDLTPLNLKAYFYNAFNACGCSELDEMHASVVRLLSWSHPDWTPSYESLYNESGVYYLLAGLLHSLSLAEHGTSIRCMWLTDDGKRLLEALQSTTVDQIYNAEGEAYDGLYYDQS
jgi:hypothetical protein